MNEDMIKKWNELVGKDDIVLHLGDFAFKNKANLIRSQLNGTIILIRGNHDTFVSQEDGFIIVEGNLIINNLILSHRPLPKEEIPEGMINIFGHIHHNPAYSGKCVCVEQTEYKPILLDSLLK
jgi:calcineurin-like phosphoesterase family protein